MSPDHAARRRPAGGPPRRARFCQPRALVLTGALALAVAGGAAGCSPASPAGQPAGGLRATATGCASAATCAGLPDGGAMAMSPAVVTVPGYVATAGAAPAASPGTPSPSPQPAGQPPATTAGTAPPGRPSASPPASSAPASAPAASAVAQVLAMINSARAQAGLAALSVSSGLTASAAAHTTEMASGCGLSHQCPGEPSLAAREAAAGVQASAEGENIGDGGPVAGTSAAIAQLAASLTQSMLAEKPPDDGHRQNILSTAFTHVGIAVIRDASGTVWLTQDFSS